MLFTTILGAYVRAARQYKFKALRRVRDQKSRIWYLASIKGIVEGVAKNCIRKENKNQKVDKKKSDNLGRFS